MSVSRYFGSYPLHQVEASIPGSYTAGDRFAIAHGLENFAGETGRRTPTVYFTVPKVEDPNRIQTIEVTGTPTGGTFTLNYGDTETAAIDYNATTAEVEAALETIVGAGNVTVTGSGDLPGNVHTATFAADVTHPELLSLNDNSLTGGTTPSVTLDTADVGAGPVVDVVSVDETYIYLVSDVATSGDFYVVVG